LRCQDKTVAHSLGFGEPSWNVFPKRGVDLAHSLGGENADQDLCSVDDVCQKQSAHLRAAQKACQKQSHDRAFLQEFLNFVRREDVKALPTIEALMTTGTRGDAAYWMGVAESEFDRLHTRVRDLARCFLSGVPVPKQRGAIGDLADLCSAGKSCFVTSRPARIDPIR